MRLRRVKISPSDLCNNTCQFCPRGNPDFYPNRNLHMSKETFDKIVEGLYEIEGNFNFEFVGHGEPTLGRHFAYMLTRLAEAKPDLPGITVRLTTNGRRIDRYWDKLDVVDEILLDVYSDDEDEFWDTVVKYQDRPNIKAIHMLNTYGKLRLLYDGHTKEVLEKNGEMLLSDRIGKYEVPLLGPTNPPKHGFCVRPSEDISISFNGDYILCCEDWENIKLGNVHEQSLKEYFTTNKALLKYREQTQAGIRKGICEGCSYPGNNKFMEAFGGANASKPWMKDLDPEWLEHMEERFKKQAALPDFPVDIKVE